MQEEKILTELKKIREKKRENKKSKENKNKKNKRNTKKGIRMVWNNENKCNKRIRGNRIKIKKVRYNRKCERKFRRNWDENVKKMK